MHHARQASMQHLRRVMCMPRLARNRMDRLQGFLSTVKLRMDSLETCRRHIAFLVTSQRPSRKSPWPLLVRHAHARQLPASTTNAIQVDQQAAAGSMQNSHVISLLNPVCMRPSSSFYMLVTTCTSLQAQYLLHTALSLAKQRASFSKKICYHPCLSDPSACRLGQCSKLGTASSVHRASSSPSTSARF
jgi:hypothetical protein